MTEQPVEPQACGVRIDAQPGHATIRIDGTALPAGQVTGYTLSHDIQAALPTLVLHTRQPDGAAFEGLARVAVGVATSPAQIVAEFLAAIDPVLLDQAALNRADYGGGEGATARAMLATLTEWAHGGKDGL
ncbi:hypothetical protein [Streptomyces scabiei]|uniref:hypothetical protein n=1 Tax=Streptomyces scabiei TaxID=1930 RepID=UPI00068EAC46|nr:hypothetical protein [Streptomyces scabiei]